MEYYYFTKDITKGVLIENTIYHYKKSIIMALLNIILGLLIIIPVFCVDTIILPLAFILKLEQLLKIKRIK
jgi:hypothetical protein